MVTAISFMMMSCNKESKAFKYVGLKVYDPVYVALEKGFFEAEGLPFQLVDTVAGGATAVQMVSSGSAQGGLVSTMALINARNNYIPVTGVTDIQSSFKDYPLEEFYVRKDSGINSIKDLKGKKIAINLIKSSFHYTWLLALEQNGMLPEDIEFVSMPFSQQEGALEKGVVDAIGLMAPYSAKARKNDNIKKLYDCVDVFGERQFCMIFINSVYAEENPEEVTKFVSALSKTCEWIKDNQQEAKEIISKYTGVDEKYIDDYKFQNKAMVVPEDIEYWLDYMIRVEHVSPCAYGQRTVQQEHTLTRPVAQIAGGAYRNPHIVVKFLVNIYQ